MRVRGGGVTESKYLNQGTYQLNILHSVQDIIDFCVFVCVDVLHPHKQFFGLVRMFCGLNRYLAEDKGILLKDTT